MAGAQFFENMPLITWDKVLRIISTILNILVSCLGAMGVTPATIDENSEANGHA